MPDSIRALVQSAEQLIDIGNLIKARDELWPVAFRYVPDDVVGRYTSVLGSGVTISSSAKLPSKTDSLRGMLSIVARPRDTLDKDRALKLLLKDYGVTDVKVDADGGRGEALLQTGEVIAFKVDVSPSAQQVKK